MRAVLNYCELMLIRNRHDLSHRTRTSREVYRYDGAGVSRDARFDIARIEVHGPGIDVAKHRCGADLNDHVYRSAERQRRRDDLVAISNTECFQAQKESSRA